MHKLSRIFVNITIMEKRLRRSQTDRVLAGVCGGIANYLNADPVAIRLAAILLTVLAGMSLWVYIIMWIIMPED